MNSWSGVQGVVLWSKTILIYPLMNKTERKNLSSKNQIWRLSTKRSVAKKSKYRMNGYSRNASVIKVLRFLNIYTFKSFFPLRVGLDIQVNSLLICRFWSSEGHIVLSVFRAFHAWFCMLFQYWALLIQFTINQNYNL